MAINMRRLIAGRNTADTVVNLVCLVSGISALGLSVQKLNAQMTAEAKPGVEPFLGYAGSWLFAALLCLILTATFALLLFAVVYDTKIYASPENSGIIISILFIVGVLATATIVTYMNVLAEIVAGVLYRTFA